MAGSDKVQGHGRRSTPIEEAEAFVVTEARWKSMPAPFSLIRRLIDYAREQERRCEKLAARVRELELNAAGEVA
jgi:hypothetical protein